jgi:TPR repeat protein
MAERRRKAAEPATGQAEPATEHANKFKKLEALVDDSASEFLCPITQELPIDPVTAEDGRVYERSAIEEWLTTNEKSPHTNEPMGKRLLPALQVKNMIATLVKSGALSADNCAAWTLKLEKEKEVEELRQHAEAGDARAMRLLAFAYKQGVGVKKDRAAAFEWATRAADLDDVAALTLVADCHLYGKGTTKDEITGLIEFGQAAALGSEHACYLLAYAYHRGLYGLKKDASKVVHWAAKMRRATGNSICDCTAENRARIEGYVAALP